PFDLLAIQIEGSGRVILEDGTPLRLNYDSHNGYSFTSISRALIERNLIPREETSIQRIREWMAAHPDEASKVRAANRSYVFFRITGLSNEGEPVGAQGVPLTPGRSIAVDRLHEYGTPFFIEANLPIESAKPTSALRRLMIAQDTGSAIVGPARADLYLGAGDDAARIAGRIRHPGRFVMLLPRELDMIAAGQHMPLPVPKPNVPELADKQEQGKVNSADEDRHQQVWTRKPPLRDCTTGSGTYCGRKPVPTVAVVSEHPSTTGQGPPGSSQERQHPRQQVPQPKMHGRVPDPQQKPQLQATGSREPKPRQQQAFERRKPQQKQQRPATEARRPQDKQSPHALEELRGEQKQPGPATDARRG